MSLSRSPATTLPPDADFAHMLALGRVGLGLVDEQLIVVERLGPLAEWLPRNGLPICSGPILFGMEETFADLMLGEAAPLTLPSVHMAEFAGQSVSISIVWNPATRHFIILTFPDEGARQLDRLIVQERRERQVLRQQAVAAAARSAISATLYRDIVETTRDAVLRLNADLSIAFVNGAAGHLLGTQISGATGRSIREILPLPQADNPWKPDMCARGAASFEQPARDRAGGTAWLWWEVRWLGDDDGPLEFQAVGRDITESRRLRAEVERAYEEAKFSALAQERLRIAHDLHDTLIHAIVNLMARLTLLKRASREGALRDELAAAEAEAREGLRTARQAVGEIRDGFDLPDGPGPALEEAAQKLRARTGMNVAVRLEDDFAGLSPQQASAALRVAREALRNVALHSGARNVTIATKLEGGTHMLDIADDGIGYDPNSERSGHYGLVGMHEQARNAGGTLNIESAPGLGLRLTLAIPPR